MGVQDQLRVSARPGRSDIAVFLQQKHADPVSLQRVGRGQSGKSRSDHDDIMNCIFGFHH